MSEANIDALLMFKQESMYWLTGYDTFGYVFFQCLVLDKFGNIILLTRAPDLRQAQNTSIIKDIRIWIDKAGANPNDDLKRILNELKLEGKKIGIEYDAYGLTGRNAMLLNKSLNGFYKIEDKSELISKLRVIKSAKKLQNLPIKLWKKFGKIQKQVLVKEKSWLKCKKLYLKTAEIIQQTNLL